jgi:prepilin peptidase CpaA
MDTALQNAAIAGFAFCLLWAAASDARGYVIPNRAVIAIAALFPIHLAVRALATGAIVPTLSDGLLALALASVVLIAGFALFAIQLVGGGDAKLAAAVALWAGSDNILAFLILASLAGGMLAAGVLLWRAAFPQRDEGAASHEDIRLRLQRGLKTPVPFGVAIAAAGLFIAMRVAGL